MKFSQLPIVFFLIVLFELLNIQTVSAQCTSPLNTFPYEENFELNDGNWTRSSTAHWEWGQVGQNSKPIITSAGSGQNCWIVGGLVGANYSSGNSYLVSPCFNLSSLINPEISFKIFWETEKNYDGVNFEYSIDQGATWLLLGSQNSDADCKGVNWFNSSSIRFLGNAPAWSGSTTVGLDSDPRCTIGNGSGAWVTAKHTLIGIIGQPKVIFRFAFGAGSICNKYDGFAIDDISIHEAPLPGADFTFQCLGNNTVNFTNTSSTCVSTVSWNFGDPSSGAMNTTTLINPAHQFSGPGNFQVTQTVVFSNGTTSVKNKSIGVLKVTPRITQALLCNGNQNGAIIADVIGGDASVLNYLWSTNPPQNTQTINNLSANNYTVAVSATDACESSATIALNEPSALVVIPTISDATCNINNGKINLTTAGGTLPYQYLWSTNETLQNIATLAPGVFSVIITDANGCTKSLNNLTVSNQIVPAIINLGDDTTICPGQIVVLQPGSFANYLWQDNSTSPTYIVAESGNYTVTVTNNAGCVATDQINVLVDCKGVYFPTSFTPNSDGLNDFFGPIGDIGSLRNFNMNIYNRWGQIVFSTTNPFVKWDGQFKGHTSSLESFVWMASYKLNGIQYSNIKGMITLIH
jgi:gliding motility-associated-like protein